MMPRMTTLVVRRLRSAGLATGTAALVAVGLLAGPGSAGAAPAGAPVKAKKSCRTSGAKIVKRKGAGVIFSRVRENEGRVYFACSTRYGKRVRLAADASELVDEIFTVSKKRVSGKSATFEYCKTFDTGRECQKVEANLRTGKAKFTTTTDDDPDGAGAGEVRKKSCGTSAKKTKIIRKKGSGVLFKRDQNSGEKAEGTVYYACSTKYRKRVRLAADASQLVDEDFEIVRTKLSGRSATFEYCKTFDSGKECHRVKADLKSGKTTETTTIDETDPGAGDDGPGDVPDDSGPVKAKKTSCRQRGAVVLKRGGAGVLYRRISARDSEDFYVCSTRYGKRIRFASNSGDVASTEIHASRVSGRSATIVTRTGSDEGAFWTRYEIDLKTRRIRSKDTPIDLQDEASTPAPSL